MKERKPIDQALRRLLEEQAATSTPMSMTNEKWVQRVRSLFVQSLSHRKSMSGLLNEVEMREVKIAPDLNAHLYRPLHPAPLPVLIYLHEGGWVAGSVATLAQIAHWLWAVLTPSGSNKAS